MSGTEPHDLVLSASYIQAVKYVSAVSLTILIYDYCLTLPREVRLFWKARWGLGKLLLLFTRYSAFIDVPLTWYLVTHYETPGRCLTMYKVTTWVAVFGIANAEGVLFLRTYALYHGKRWIFKFLVSFYAVMLTTDITIAALFLRSLQFGEAPNGLRGLGGCHATAGSSIIFVAFCTIIFQETVILIMTLYEGFKVSRFSTSRYLKTFFRDGIFYYIYILLISAGNIALLVAGPVALFDLINTFQRVMHSVLATRILLHVRETMENDRHPRDAHPMVSPRQSNRRPGHTPSNSDAIITISSERTAAVH